MSKKQDQEKPFDFEAFIANLDKPGTRTVTVTTVDHAWAIEQIEEKIAELTDEAGGRQRMSQKSPVRLLAQEAERLRSEMEQSQRKFVLRSLRPADLARFRAMENPDTMDAQAEQLSLQLLSPKMSKDECLNLAEELHPTAWSELISTGTMMSLSEVKTPDFSHATLAALSEKGSAAS